MLARFIAVAVASLLLGQPPLAAQEERVTVVELFTSQGCSVCPHADVFLGELSARPDILAFSEHVDYWDYLGWQDRFASHGNTQRQRAYARRLGLSYVYTPQVVVHGIAQAAGTDRDTVLRLIAEIGDLPWVPVRLEQGGDGPITARLEPTALLSPVDIWLVRFDPKQTTMIERGENRGRQLQNYNVVREFTRLAMWNGEAMSLPIVPPMRAGGGTFALILQQGEGGRILGAARLAKPKD
jgi:hypothetical protein